MTKVKVLRAEKHIPKNGIQIMIANVYQDNTNYSGCLAEIARVNPDVVLLLETDTNWQNETNSLNEKFEYKVEVPLDNKYGMLLYSKFPLENAAVHYMVEDDIPSIHREIVLENGQHIQLFAVHPTPPVPNENPSSKSVTRNFF